MMRSVRVALAVGLALVAIAVAVVLTRSPPTVAGTNSVPPLANLGYLHSNQMGCQSGETLPRDTSAIRVPLGSSVGPRVTAKVLSGSQLVTAGARAAGWGPAETVTIPVARVPRTISNVSLCLAVGPVTEPVEVKGSGVPAAQPNGRTGQGVKIGVEYLRAGGSSWWSLVSPVAHRMGLGHAASGTWIVYLELALMVGVVVLASRLLLETVALPGWAPTSPAGAPRGDPRPEGEEAVRSRETLRVLRSIPPRILRALRSIPRAAWICAIVAALSAACWSFITPPFQVPDEPSHFAYVQQLAEAASLPTSNKAHFAEEEEVALQDLHHSQVRYFPERHPISTTAEQRRLQQDLGRPLARRGEGDANVAASQPPLYYALQTIPYFLRSGGTILDRLALMRLLSALMAGATALFGYLFVREALPRVRWAWTVGGLGIALVPVLGFMSGGVNPDAMVFAVTAAGFFCLARAFRYGLTATRAAAIGAVVAVGSLTKLNFIGLAPGLVLGLIVLAVRAARTSGRAAWRWLALGLAIAVTPACVYLLVNLARGHSVLGSVSQVLHPTGRGSLLGEISYIWQFYLPRLPGMAVDFPGISPVRAIWFNRSIGHYGWLDTLFPTWVYNLALIPAGLIAILAVRALVSGRAALRRRLPELLVYGTLVAGLMVLTGAASYIEFPAHPGEYGEPRYLLALIPLVGVWLALSARGAGRRWGPVAGTLIAVSFIAWNLFSQLQMIARYYG
jgi:hypothetical protein